METGLLLFRLLVWREVCCCSGCWDGKRSVVVQVVRMVRGLLLSRLSGWLEVCCYSQCEGREHSVIVVGVRCYLDDEGSPIYP